MPADIFTSRTEDEIIAFVRTLPGAVAVTVDAGSGAPEVAWGDSFFYYDPDGDSPRRTSVLTLSLSFDHRHIDGEAGSRFLADVAAIVEDPATALLF